MEVNEQTLYDDELLNILPDGVIILDINGKIIQLNQQALTELHVHSSVNTMMPLPTSQIFKLLNNKEDILSTILEKISQGERIYTLPEHTYIQEQVDHTQFPIRGEFATIRNKGNLKTILFFFRNITVELTQEYILNTALQRTRIYPWYYDINRSEFTLDNRYFTHLGIPAGENNTLTMEEYVSMIHPDDRQTMADAFVVQLSGIETFDKAVPFRLRRGDGTWEWFEGQSTYIANISGHPYRLVGICMSIQEYKDIENTLIEARKKAEESDRLKMAFLANMSHEIRTPLNAIVGFSNLLPSAETLEEEKLYSSIINQNSEILLQLINDILDLSKIEAGTLEYVRQPMNLSEICRNIYQIHKDRVQEGVTLILDNQDEDLIIEEDRNRIAQVITNFLTNAGKFTLSGEIRFGFKVNNQCIRFYVKDTGIGIAPDKVGHIFDRFVKLNSFAQGTGLGLAICRMIIEKIGGEIGVTSEIGKGSTFYFTIPYKESSDDRIAFSEASETKYISHTIKRMQKIKKILVAEDVDSNFVLIKNMIGKDYTLLWAKDGFEAVEMYKQFQPDLILMDIKMPRMGGLEATRIIRSYSKEIPVIALTAYAFEADKEQALEAGCNDFVTKPVSKAALEEALGKCSG